MGRIKIVIHEHWNLGKWMVNIHRYQNDTKIPPRWWQTGHYIASKCVYIFRNIPWIYTCIYIHCTSCVTSRHSSSEDLIRNLRWIHNDPWRLKKKRPAHALYVAREQQIFLGVNTNTYVTPYMYKCVLYYTTSNDVFLLRDVASLSAE